MEVSKRLTAIANEVSKGNVVCDVGTDHGYLSIYLIKNNISPKVIAMDVAKGPLSKAQDNIKAYNCSEQIETRLSDGVAELKKDEAKTIVIAGMGGILITEIMQRGREIFESVEELIVSPHTDIELVRKFLLSSGFMLKNEIMINDEGKNYVIMKAVHGDSENYSECEMKFGPLLLSNKNEILEKHLEEELGKAEKLIDNLSSNNSEAALNRKKELERDIQLIKEGLKYYEV